MAIWKDIPGMNGIYTASVYGEIVRKPGIIEYSNGGKRFHPGRILPLNKTPGGYVSVGISIGGVSKNYFLHRLIALTFIPNPENKPQVNHKNGNKEDNSVNNLEWCTKSENEKHAYDVLGKKPGKSGLGKCGSLNGHSKKVIMTTPAGEVIHADSARDLCRKYNLNPTGISQVISGKRSHYKGYSFTLNHAG